MLQNESLDLNKICILFHVVSYFVYDELFDKILACLTLIFM